MTSFNDAWFFLKATEEKPLGYTPADYDREDNAGLSIDEFGNYLDTSSDEPHTKEEILDLMVRYGALVGRMPHKIGSPEWSENMDDLESTGIFDSLDHHYGESNLFEQHFDWEQNYTGNSEQGE